MEPGRIIFKFCALPVPCSTCTLVLHHVCAVSSAGNVTSTRTAQAQLVLWYSCVAAAYGRRMQGTLAAP